MAIRELKLAKAPGFDGLHNDFFVHCTRNAVKSLAQFFSDILKTGCISTDLKKAKILALLKPGKPKTELKVIDP